jgi:hypothetical protein
VQGAADESGAVGWLSAFALALVGQPLPGPEFNRGVAVRSLSEISDLQFEIATLALLLWWHSQSLAPTHTIALFLSQQVVSAIGHANTERAPPTQSS